MIPFIDTHTHYHDIKFEQDRESILSSLPAVGVKAIINCATDIPTCTQTQRLSESYSFVFSAYGIHGLDVKNAVPDDLNRLKDFLSDTKCVAIGEIGLDYHYEIETKEKQLFYFEEQLQFASEYDLPVIVHDREAHEDTIQLLKKYRPRGVVHCFSGSAEMAKEVVKLGMYLGFGGAVTFKGARKPLEAAVAVPLDYILMETDCPYMSPVPFRGKRCDSSMIPYSASFLAEKLHISSEMLLQKTTENAEKLFRICL